MIDKPRFIPAWIAVLVFSPFITLPTAVAVASANVAFSVKTIAASASPKLSAWLNRPELVAMAMGDSLSRKPNRLERASSPAATATSTGWSESAMISPPFSTTATLHPVCFISVTARSAMAPATAAMGPTSAFVAASAIIFATRGFLGATIGVRV